MGKWVLFIIFLMGAVNGFWYCTTQQETIGQTPLIIIPSLCSIGIVIYIVAAIRVTWD